MGTGEIQLVSYAEEDKYIMGNPQITFLNPYIENILILQ